MRALLGLLIFTIVSCQASNRPDPVFAKTQTPHANARMTCLRLDTTAIRLDSRDHVLVHSLGQELKGQNLDAKAKSALASPFLKTVAKPARRAAPLDKLLAVDVQTGCETVKFSTGETFKILGGDAGSVTLANEKTGERRRYALGLGELFIETDRTVELNDCGGTPRSARESTGVRVAWDDASRFARVRESFARDIGLKFTAVRPRKGDPLRLVQVPVETFDAKVSEPRARAAAVCP